MSKGSNARPFNIKYKEYSNNWDRIFGKKDKDKNSNEVASKNTENKKTK